MGLPGEREVVSEVIRGGSGESLVGGARQLGPKCQMIILGNKTRGKRQKDSIWELDKQGQGEMRIFFKKRKTTGKGG